MFTRLLILCLSVPGIGFADEAAAPSDDQSAATVVELEEAITSARLDFTSKLKSEQMSPEERAIRIERWQKEQAAWIEQTRRLRAGLAKRTNPTASSPNQPTESEAAAAIPDDPLLADIHEIESEIGDFRKSLDDQNLTAEQRATQVELFHQINRETLDHLKLLKRQAATRNVTSAAALSTVQTPADRTPVEAELNRVMRDLAVVDPETRAQYLEAHAGTLDALSREVAKATHFQFPTDQETSTDHQTQTTESP